MKEAYALNQPFKAIKGAAINGKISFVSFNTDGVELDAVKRSEDGRSLVIRFHDYTGSRQKVKVTPGFDWDSWCESSLMEKTTGDWNKGEILTEVRPYEIKTLLLNIK